jgi:hypothetical protein
VGLFALSIVLLRNGFWNVRFCYCGVVMCCSCQASVPPQPASASASGASSSAAATGPEASGPAAAVRTLRGSIAQDMEPTVPEVSGPELFRLASTGGGRPLIWVPFT